MKINANEVPRSKIDDLPKYLREMGYIDIGTSGKLIYAKKRYGRINNPSDEYRTLFYVNGKKFRKRRNFYVHIYLGEEIRIKALELHCFEVLSYLIGETRARIIMNIDGDRYF